METSGPFKIPLLLVCLTGITVGCGKQKPIITTKNDIQTSLHVKQDCSLAKLFDVPLPLGYSISHLEEIGQTTLFEATGNLNQGQLIHFYQHRMEEQGWNIRSLVTKKEGLLLCSKPSRLCTISIRPVITKKKNLQNIATVHLFVHHRRTQNNNQTQIHLTTLLNEKIQGNNFLKS